MRKHGKSKFISVLLVILMALAILPAGLQSVLAGDEPAAGSDGGGGPGVLSSRVPVPVIFNDRIIDEASWSGIQAVVHGIAAPGMTVKLVSNDDTATTLAQTTADSQGKWEASLNTSVLSDVYAVAEDSNGDRSGITSNLTRAEVAQLVLALAGLTPNLTYKGYFSDVSVEYWAWPYIEAVADAGLIGGYADGTFGPEEEVTRAEFAKILFTALGLTPDTSGLSFDDTGTVAWASDAIMTERNNGLLYGYPNNKFRPYESVKAGPVLLCGAIKGVIQGESDSGTPEPLEGASVWVTPVGFNDAPAMVGQDLRASTDAHGAYQVIMDEPGGYQVEFSGPDGTMLEREYYNNKRIWNQADTITVSLGAESVADASLEMGGVIRGTVLGDSTSTPVPLEGSQVEVTPVLSNGEYDSSRESELITPESDGSYESPVLVPGDYELQFIPPAGLNYAGESRTVTITKGEVFIANATLEQGGAITGTVMGESSDVPVALKDVRVGATPIKSDGTTDTARIGWAVPTVEDGSYEILGLAPGLYRVDFDPGTNTEYVAGSNTATVTIDNTATIDIMLKYPDTTAPTTTLTTDPTSPNSNGWFTTDTTVSLSSNEPGKIYYKWGSASDYSQYTDQIYAPQGENTLYFYSVDVAGNIEDAQTRMFKVDTVLPTAPVFDSIDTITPANMATVTVSGLAEVGSMVYITASDGTKDVTTTALAGGTFSAIMNLSELADGMITFTARSQDEAGNESPQSLPAEALKDTTAPDTSANLSGTSGNNGWYTSDVTVTLVAADGTIGSGVSSTEYSLDGENWQAYTIPIVVSGEGTSTVYYRSTDNIGNTEPVTTQTVKIDRTAPTITGAPTTEPNADGWYNTDVTVHFTASDTPSGVDTVTPDTMVSTEGAGQSVAGTVTDTAGNSADCTVDGINIDKICPTTAISLDRPANNDEWYKANVTVTLSASDSAGGSGLVKTEYSLDGSSWTTYTDPFTITSEGTTTVYYRSVDKAGNTEPNNTQIIKIDRTAPEISGLPTTPVSSSGWYNKDVTVHFTATDTGSGIAEVTPDQVLSDEGANVAKGWATDTAGNSSLCLVGPIKIDRTPPQTNAYLAPIPPASGWYTSAVAITLGRLERLSGIDRTEYSFDGSNWTPYTGQITVSSEGMTTVHYRSIDNAGNTETPQTQVIKIDSKAPTIPRPTVKALPNSDFMVTWPSSVDTGSGVDHYMVNVGSTSGHVSTSTAGTSYTFKPAIDTNYTISVKAVDKLGQQSTNGTTNAMLKTKVAPTPVGNDVAVVVKPSSAGSSPVTISFSSVTAAGNTTVTASATNTGGSISGFTVQGSYYEIKTSAVTAGTITITLPYSDSGLTPAQEAALKLYHYEDGAWKDITTNVDTTNNLITGRTTSLSPFVVGIPKTQDNGGGNNGGNNDGDNGDNNNGNNSGGTNSGNNNGGGGSGGSGDGSDTQAPAAPKGLKATTANHMVHLVWNPNKETDLAGYNVYRQDGDQIEKLNKNGLIHEVQYQDNSDLKSGARYSYYVTAVDMSGSESAKEGAKVDVTVPIVKGEVVFSDVPSNAWYKDAVSRLASQEILGGYSDGTFKPDKNITRAEFAKMICLAMGWTLDNPTQSSFGDVARGDWEYRYVETARAYGVISGYQDGTFKPNKNITRAEIAKIIAEALNLPAGSSTLSDIGSSWARSYINSCVKAGIIKGYADNTFGPSNTATRAEAASMIAGMLDVNK